LRSEISANASGEKRGEWEFRRRINNRGFRNFGDRFFAVRRPIVQPHLAFYHLHGFIAGIDMELAAYSRPRARNTKVSACCQRTLTRLPVCTNARACDSKSMIGI
jgi:hypothetical protein